MLQMVYFGYPNGKSQPIQNTIHTVILVLGSQKGLDLTHISKLFSVPGTCGKEDHFLY